METVGKLSIRETLTFYTMDKPWKSKNWQVENCLIAKLKLNFVCESMCILILMFVLLLWLFSKGQMYVDRGFILTVALGGKHFLEETSVLSVSVLFLMPIFYCCYLECLIRFGVKDMSVWKNWIYQSFITCLLCIIIRGHNCLQRHFLHNMLRSFVYYIMLAKVQINGYTNGHEKLLEKHSFHFIIVFPMTGKT